VSVTGKESAVTANEVNSAESSEPVILARRVVSLSRTDAETLIRFAAEFLCRAKYAEATPAGLEAAYLDTVPIDAGCEDVHVVLQDLGERVHDALGEDFQAWARREPPVRQLTCEIAGRGRSLPG
jgi:hypothetical protein